MDTTLAAPTAPHTLMASSAYTSSSNSDNLDDWMFNKQGGKCQNGSGSESVTTADSSSWSWFEPLENIISSASTSSVGSPIEDQAVANEVLVGVDANNNANGFFGNSEAFFTEPSSYANSPDASTVVKREETDEDDLDVKFLPDIDSLATLKDPATTTNGKKKRAPRKRLTSHQKQAHNKIEKRYRININTKIAKLQQIIPWVASEQTAFEVGDSVKREDAAASSTAPATTGNKDSVSIAGQTPESTLCASSSTKLNKSMILEKAVDYILYLQNSERLYEMEVQRLKNELDALKRSR